MRLPDILNQPFGWRRRLLVVAAAAVLGIAVGVTATAAGLFGGGPPDPNDIARPAGVPGTPGALTEVRKCPGPTTPAHLACGPKDRVP